MPACYSQRLDEAVLFAMDAFRSRRRKATDIPYLTHLLQVMCIVGEHGGDEDQLIAAVLHDWLEDIPGADTAVLRARWGERVQRMVEALSDSTGEPKPPWKERKERYLAHLRAQPAEVKLISAADKLHNCMSIRRDHAAVGDTVWDRFNAGRDGTLWYYQAVTDALAEGWDHPLHHRLAAEVGLLLAEAR
jgi:(p)ppGpp synthase/HD superfamily hydrolase